MPALLHPIVDGKKVCSQCHVELPIAVFYFDRTEQRYKPYCRKCDTARHTRDRAERRARAGWVPTRECARAVRPTPFTICCKLCHEEKPYHAFHRLVQSDPTKRKVVCRVCTRARLSHRRKTDTNFIAREKRAYRKYTLKALYGMTVEEYQTLSAAQDNVCAICRQPETARRPDGKPKRLAVDHDHGSGQIRGLLCAACNTTLGLLRENLIRFQQAVDYLRRWGVA